MRTLIAATILALTLVGCASLEKAEARFGQALTEHATEQEAARTAHELEVARIYSEFREGLLTAEEKTEQLAAATAARDEALLDAWTEFKDESVSAGRDALSGIPTTGNGWVDLLLGGGGLLGVFNAYRNRSMPGAVRLPPKVT
jgi:hypothetical protein